MSVIKPEIDTLLERTEHNPFLLCSVASKRACDINNMLRGQHLRVTAIQDFDDITTVASGKDSVSIAMGRLPTAPWALFRMTSTRLSSGENAGIQ
jgi:DNA-directed RNA polymerase subunit omega